MGKSQKKRAMRRHNPMRVSDSHLPKGLASAASSSSKNEAILPIIQKMESLDAAERKWACVAVSNLIQNDPSTRRLLQGKNIVGVLITRLSDSEEEVVIEAAGTLRNLCIDGGYDICAEMYNKNILAPLTTFVPKISTTLAQFLESPKTAPENAQKVVYEFADNIITTLWCLSETSNKALNAINQINLVPFLMSFLASRKKLPVSTVTAAAHCLYVLTDDNYPAINDIRSNSAYVICLLEVIRQEQVFQNGKTTEPSDERETAFRVLVSGILRNLSPLPPSFNVDIDKDIVLPLLQPIVSSVSLLDASNTASDLVLKENSEPRIDKLSLNHMPQSDHKTATEIELERLESKLRTVQLALEILIGVCATLPDPESELGAEDPDNDDEDEDALDSGADEMVLDEHPPAETLTSSTNSSLPALVHPLLHLIHPTLLSFPPAGNLSPHPPTTSAISAIHISALECLNNIFLSLSTSPNSVVASDKGSGCQIWDEIWSALALVGRDVGPGQERKQEIWDVSVGVLWGVGNIWKGTLVPNMEQIRILVQLCDASPDPRMRVKCIGTLECLAQHPKSIEANLAISSYLLSVMDSAKNPLPAGAEPLIQAVSALIDIYSDEDKPYDVNFRQGRFIDELASNVESVKKVVRAIDRRKEGGKELRRRGDEVRENLIAFIQYRKDLDGQMS